MGFKVYIEVEGLRSKKVEAIFLYWTLIKQCQLCQFQKRQFFYQDVLFFRNLKAASCDNMNFHGLS